MKVDLAALPFYCYCYEQSHLLKKREKKRVRCKNHFDRKPCPILHSSSHYNDRRGVASSHDWAFIEANQFSHGIAFIYRWLIPYIWNNTNLLGVTNGFTLEYTLVLRRIIGTIALSSLIALTRIPNEITGVALQIKIPWLC